MVVTVWLTVVKVFVSDVGMTDVLSAVESTGLVSFKAQDSGLRITGSSFTFPGSESVGYPAR